MTIDRSASIAVLRKQGLRARRALPASERHRASRRIANRVTRAHEFVAANRVACYLATDHEVATHTIMHRAWSANKRVFAPIIDFRGGMAFSEIRPDTLLERNAYGLWEPVNEPCIPADKLDLVVTPVVAFDDDCHRIGMGAGYFDRCFAFLKHRRHWLRPKLFGLAFACQRVEKIAPNPWDIRVYRVYTEIA